MPIVTPKFEDYTVKAKGMSFKKFKEVVVEDGYITEEEILKQKYERAPYEPDEEEKEMRELIIRDFTIGTENMWTPRVEFNDLSVIQRLMVDQMAFNTYQPNNGYSAGADDIQGWRSNAMRPVVRNKVVSIAAHATARLIFPKVFAFNNSSDEERDAANVIEDLMEYAADQSDYRTIALHRTISALTDPVSIGYTEYGEVYRRVKKEKKDDKWEYDVILDDTLSGFQDIPVNTDELFIENFYEPDIQKQGFVIWRRVISYSLARAKYSSMYEKFNEHVRPGVNVLYSDANSSFYYVSDPNMTENNVEEIIYWNKALDVKIIMGNGVILNDADNPNPRNDKMYPFDKFGYELINNRCFYYKSLAFKMQQDANIINTLYPMVIDGTYLEIMKPTFNVGGEIISSDVIVPGANTTLSDPDAKLAPIFTQPINLASGINTLNVVEKSLDESSQDPIAQGQSPKGTTTAYEISRIEQNAATVLGLFLQMIAKHVRDFGNLRLGDILQYLTIADVNNITDDKELTYKTFLIPDKQTSGGTKTRKIEFDGSLNSEPETEEEKLENSYNVLKKQGGMKANTELYKVNPELIRNLKYMITVSPDILNPRSTDLERAYDLEHYDRAINNPKADQEENFRLLLNSNPKTRKNPDKYVIKDQVQAPQMNPKNNQASPLNALKQKGALPQQTGGQLPV